MKVLITIIILGLLSWGGFAVGDLWYHSVPVSYKGQVSLTESEFWEFKDIITDDRLTVRNLDVLNTKEPIVIWYNFSAPKDFNFPYGNGSQFDDGIVVIAVTVFIEVVLWCLVIFVAMGGRVVRK